MATRIQLRRDTTANWASSNPTLASGEIGIDTTLNIFKIGNGSTAWNSLAAFSGGGSSDWGDIGGTITDQADLISAINAKVADAINNGTTTVAPSQNAVFDALATKQDTLVSGTNIKTVNGNTLLGSGNLVISGGGSGVSFTFSATAPADTSVVWVDTASEANAAYPIRYYIDGAWTPVTDTCDYWDYVGEIISKGKPIGVLFSGQSNAGHSFYFSAAEPTYTGDLTVDPGIAYWEHNVSHDWEVYDFNTSVYPFMNTSVGINNVIQFCKLLHKDTKRSIRIVGTCEPGVILKEWENGSYAYTKLKLYADDSSIDKFDTFLWIHGEAGLGVGSAFADYRASFMDMVSRLRAETWADKTLKIIAPSHALGHDTNVPTATSAEGTIRGLKSLSDPWTMWAPIADTKETKAGGVVDNFHFTIREGERCGISMYGAYKSLPNLKKALSPSDMFAGFTGNSLTTYRINYPQTNNLFYSWNPETNNSGEFRYEFAGAGVATTKVVAKPSGTFGQVWYDIWTNGAGGAEATIANLATRWTLDGTYFAKPVMVRSRIEMASAALNSGDMIIDFEATGVPATFLNTNAIGKTAIVVRPTGASGLADLRIITAGSTNTANIVADTRFIFTATNRFGIVIASPTARLHIFQGETDCAPIRMTSGALTTGANRFAGNLEFLTDKLYFTITTGTSTKEIALCDIALTSGRVSYSTINGRQTDSASWLFDGSAMSLLDIPLTLGTTTGTKFGTAASQKLGFWNATPIVQPTTAIAAATFAANTSAIANDTATFDGYTIGQVVKALRNSGILA